MKKLKIYENNKHTSISLPHYHGDAGYDLKYYGKKIIIKAKSFKKIKLSFNAIIPNKYWIEIAAKSGLASKGLSTIGNVIDSSYTGNWHVIIVNFSNKNYTINNGDKVCQAIIRKHHHLKLHFLNFKKFNNANKKSLRKTNGFGSTGA